MKSLADIFAGKSPLPDQLPDDPFPIVVSWLDEAMQRQDQPNPNAIALATTSPDGRPSVRQVLCKGIDAATGQIVFYTNYTSPKAADLDATGLASVCFFWDHQGRQVRLEGRVVRSPAAESDAYFASRAWQSRVGAWASDQSKPIASRSALLDKVMTTISELGLSLPALLLKGKSVEIPRPLFWGGYRLYASAVEIWVNGTGRIHDRARWERTVEVDGDTVSTGDWSATRLQP
jgi:pyridoxamine 5'-phosphate oxidase